MSKFLQLAVVAATVAGLGASAQAQQVAMYGEYSESNGIVVNIPQNPPIVPCPDPSLVKDARCHRKVQQVLGVVQQDKFDQPQVGNRAARNIPVHPLDADGDGMDVGDPFIIPPLAFRQQLGRQGGVVLRDTVDWLDTTFIAAMPGANRQTFTRNAATPMGTRAIAPLERNFSQMNWTKPGNAQNNAKLAGGGVWTPGRDNDWLEKRPAPVPAGTKLVNVINATSANETLQMTYTLGPRQFGGTMTTLLDGGGHLYLRDPGLDAIFPAQVRPIVATLPLGDAAVEFNTRNAGGWNMTTQGGQDPGRFLGFPGPLGAFLPPACNDIGEPAGCNKMVFEQINQGIFLAAFGSATSVKYMYPLTTGTVSIVRTGVRNGQTATDTNTAMGYDTVTNHPIYGQVRNVGLVAGSYTNRFTLGNSERDLNFQVLGVSLLFTPEPVATAALASGLGMLGLLAYRRRS